MITFRLPINPPKATSQGAGKRLAIVAGRPMFFKNKAAKSAEHDLTVLCSRHAPEEPMTGPLVLKIDFVFPWRKSEPKRRLALGIVPHTSKPDASNIIKMIEDVLTRLRFWEDDSQVSDLRVTKSWGDEVGIRVTVRGFDEPETEN
jgi:Holliday junction resolvase RusA-like endonuclease